jgi:hypothetical protein
MFDPMIGNPNCIQCGIEMKDSHVHKKYCSRRCKSLWAKAHPWAPLSQGHDCRVCGTHIDLKPGQANKWICSADCRRKQLASSVRKFHALRPERALEYRGRTRTKLGPDSNIKRFYLWNPSAPHACESCGENRVLEIAHKPGHERVGAGRAKANSSWPSMVWVLCPTCHTLLDRMNYPPSDLGLCE